MRVTTIHGSRQLKGEEAVALRIAASRAIRAKAEERKAEPATVIPIAADRPEIQRAMLYVEHRLVLALWVLARLPTDKSIGFARRNGVPYLADKLDLYANALERGRWEAARLRPAPPSSKAIDAMHEPLDWLQLLPRDRAKLLTVGAQSKRGDPKRNVSWPRIRQQMPELAGLSTRTLQRRYSDGLRALVTELAISKGGNQ